MEIDVINIGNELLIGQVINTNAAWIGEQMNLAGFMVNRFIVIADDPDAIRKGIQEAMKRSAIVMVTGGLGPTKDDITKDAICRCFGTHLVFNQEAFLNIKKFFDLRGIPVSELNRKQAEIPENCIPIQNKNGTAPGMWFEIDKPEMNEKSIMVSMPGVPFEMKAMMTEEIIPRLKKIFRPRVIIHKTVMTQGIGESFLSDIIEDWEKNLPRSISLAYLPQPGIVRLRLTASGEDLQRINIIVEEEIQKLQKVIPEYIYGYDDEKLEEIIGNLMIQKGATMATAESCTGGYIAHLITTIPGSSAYFKGSVVAYSNEIKVSELGVNSSSLDKFGAVSEEVVKEMASGIRSRFNCDYAVATSGIAGPDGGTEEKPVGTTWIAVATPAGVFAWKYLFGDNRERNIRRTALQALNLLRKTVLKG
jgi:nicotinamide-nucleotide amidase